MHGKYNGGSINIPAGKIVNATHSFEITTLCHDNAALCFFYSL